MRKHDLVARVLLLLGIPGVLSAQSIGIKAGASFGNISNKGTLPGNLDNRTGWAGGVYLGFGGLLGFGAEALYAQRGAKSDDVSATAETRLDYIDIPMYLKVAPPVPAIQPFLYAGPQLSYEMKCRTGAGEHCTGAGYSANHSKWDYAAIIGAGVRIGGSKLGFGLEGRYVYGLKDLKFSTVTSGESYKNRTFMLLASIGK